MLNGAELPTPSDIVAPPAASSKDRLEYIADMVRERKMMSAQANCHTLASLLEMAYREARRQGKAGA